MVLTDPRQAEAAVEEAFRYLRCDGHVPGDAGQPLRLRLLQLVFAAALERETGRPVHPPPHPSTAIGALPPNERRTLALCLHGVSCAALDASDGAPLGTSILRLHRALGLVRSARASAAAPRLSV